MGILKTYYNTISVVRNFGISFTSFVVSVIRISVVWRDEISPRDRFVRSASIWKMW